ncbi:4'-phosphopantetheinyl transferase family protein [Xylanimonas oleitrophica]|nr:4'-phosphopantetheinyl transferase superfamily protein [Xylanimonas oleitrophica]
MPEFSLSYSGSVVAVAVSVDPVGVDVERLPDGPTVHAVACLLDPREAGELAAFADPDERRRRFARLWVMKEAYLKATGTGITDGVAQPYFGTSIGTRCTSGWLLAPLDAPAGYAAAVAVRSGDVGEVEE